MFILLLLLYNCLDLIWFPWEKIALTAYSILFYNLMTWTIMVKSMVENIQWLPTFVRKRDIIVSATKMFDAT